MRPSAARRSRASSNAVRAVLTAWRVRWINSTGCVRGRPSGEREREAWEGSDPRTSWIMTPDTRKSHCAQALVGGLEPKWPPTDACCPSIYYTHTPACPSSNACTYIFIFLLFSARATTLRDSGSRNDAAHPPDWRPQPISGEQLIPAAADPHDRYPSNGRSPKLFMLSSPASFLKRQTATRSFACLRV